jgi:glycine/D-amino acid oxidase-like deaminating enzyme
MPEVIRMRRRARRDERGGAPPLRSPWLLEALAGAPALEPQRGATRTDVAIVGGGYVGLWTALELKRRDPSTDVVVLEGDVCGGGASGRNGGQIHSWWDRLSALIAVCRGDAEEAVRLARASAGALDELERLGLDIDLRRDGWVWTATTPAQLGAWEETVATAERFGGSPYRALTRAEVVAKTGSDVHLAGVWEPAGGTVHPARLVRGLLRLALDAGVRVHEHTDVVAIEPGARVRTEGGHVDAGRVVLATGAWSAALPEFARRLFVVASDVVATRAVPDRLDALGWTGGQAICDSQARVLYYQRTPAGRVVFGRGGGTIALGGRIGTGFDRSDRFARDTASALRRVYPRLADVPIEHAWAGPVDRTLSHLPIFGALRANPAVVYGVGWSGSGVAQSVLGGRILASLALDADDEWSRCGLVDQAPLHFPPDPLRYAGAHVVRAAIRRGARAEDRGRRPGPVAARLAALSPSLEKDRTQ